VISTNDRFLPEPEAESINRSPQIPTITLMTYIADGLHELCSQAHSQANDNSPFAVIRNHKPLSDFFLHLIVCLKPCSSSLLVFLTILFRLKTDEETRQGEEKQNESRLFLTTTIYGVIATALFVATKYAEDHAVALSNGEYAKAACGISLKEFNLMERSLLSLLHWKIWPITDVELYNDLYVGIWNKLLQQKGEHDYATETEKGMGSGTGSDSDLGTKTDAGAEGCETGTTGTAL